MLPPLSLTVAWPCLLETDASCPESFRMALPPMSLERR